MGTKEYSKEETSGKQPEDDGLLEFNFLREPLWKIYGKVGKAYNVARNTAIDLVFFAIIAIAVPLLVFGLGLTIGGVADWSESEGAADFARSVVTVGTFMGALGIFILWVRTSAVVHLAHGGSQAANGIFSKIPKLDAEKQTDPFLLWIRGIGAWACFGYLGTMLLNGIAPVWRNMGLFGIILVGVAGFVMMAGWIESKIGRTMALTMNSLFVLMALVFYFSPAANEFYVQHGRRYLGSHEYALIKAKAAKQTAQVLKSRYAELVDEKARIEAGMERCNGRICESKRARYDQILEEMASLDDGTYMEKVALAKAKEPAKEKPKAKPAEQPAAPKPSKESDTDTSQQVGSKAGKSAVAYRVPARNDPVWKLLD